MQVQNVVRATENYFGIKFTKNDSPRFGTEYIWKKQKTQCRISKNNYDPSWKGGKEYIGVDVDHELGGVGSPCDSEDEAIDIAIKLLEKVGLKKANFVQTRLEF